MIVAFINGHAETEQGDDADEDDDARGWRSGSRRDTYSQKHTGKPYNDRFLLVQGYEFRCAYNYPLPEAKAPLYQAVRYELRAGITPTAGLPSKKFLARRMWNGQLVFGAGVRRIPYNYGALLKAGPGADVVATEGEKNSDQLMARGILATTVLSHDWTPECAAALTGMHVMIPEDNDDRGRAYAQAALQAIEPYAASVRVVSCAHLWRHLDPEKAKGGPGDGDDIGDWVELGGDTTRLFEICRELPVEGAIVPLDISAWDDEPAPAQRWSVPDRFPLRQTALFSGEGGQGKSYVGLHLAIAHTAGCEWLGAMPEAGPAFFIDCEDDADVMHYRAAAIAAHCGVRFSTLVGRLHLISWFGDIHTALAASSRRSGTLEPTARYHRLLEMAGAIKPKMIVIASSADVFAGNEIDRAQVRQFTRLLNRIAIAAEGTVLLISHPSLAGISSGSGLSGSTQWHNGPRARAVMSNVKENGAMDGLRKIDFLKNQYGAIANTVFVRWQNGLFLPVDAAVVSAAERMQRAEDVFLKLLERFTAQKQELSPHQSGKSAASAFARHPEAGGLTYQDFSDAQQRLLDTGKIEIDAYGPPSKRRARLAIVRKEG